LFRKIDQHIANQGGGVMVPQDNAIGIPDEVIVIVEPVVDDGSESESGVEAVIVDDLDGGAGAEDFVPDAVIVDEQGGDEDSEVKFDFNVAKGRGVGANAVVGAENMLPANHIVPAAPAGNGGNGRPRRALAVLDYNENNPDLDVEIGAESPVHHRSGSKRRRQL